MSLSNLQENGLFVILFINDPDLSRKSFHWGLYHHYSVARGGCVYHIKGSPGSWYTDHGVTYGVLKAFLLIGLVQVAVVPPRMKAYTDQTIRKLDDQVNGFGGMTCRVYVLLALERLRVPYDGQLIVICDDLLALEDELKEWAYSEAPRAYVNVQPRPVRKSVACIV